VSCPGTTTAGGAAGRKHTRDYESARILAGIGLVLLASACFAGLDGATSTLTPYLYAQIAFAMLGGWAVFSQMPDRLSLVGIAAIALCGAAGASLTVRERRTPIEPAQS